MRSVWLIGILLAGAAGALALDMPAYHFVRGCIWSRGLETSQVVKGFEDFAQTIPPLAIVWAIWRLDRRQGRQVVLRMVLAFVMSGAVTGIGKLGVGRYRPGHFPGQTWSQTWIDAGFHSRKSREQSFFSGHSAAAFSMATIMSAYYPPLRPVVYTLAGGCALSRVATGNHWLSDVYIGSLAGVGLGWLFLPAGLRWKGRRRSGLPAGAPAGEVGAKLQ
jgi:undecaprenyl-diphosphatase